MRHANRPARAITPSSAGRSTLVRRASSACGAASTSSLASSQRAIGPRRHRTGAERGAGVPEIARRTGEHGEGDERERGRRAGATGASRRRDCRREQQQVGDREEQRQRALSAGGAERRRADAHVPEHQTRAHYDRQRVEPEDRPVHPRPRHRGKGEQADHHDRQHRHIGRDGDGGQHSVQCWPASQRASAPQSSSWALASNRQPRAVLEQVLAGPPAARGTPPDSPTGMPTSPATRVRACGARPPKTTADIAKSPASVAACVAVASHALDAGVDGGVVVGRLAGRVVVVGAGGPRRWIGGSARPSWGGLSAAGDDMRSGKARGAPCLADGAPGRSDPDAAATYSARKDRQGALRT